MADILLPMPRIREIRLENKLSQTEMATKVGISQPMLSTYERGLHLPDIHTLIEIGKLFNVSLDYLVGVSDIRCPYGGAMDRLYNTYHGLNLKEKKLLKNYIDVLSENWRNTDV